MKKSKKIAVGKYYVMPSLKEFQYIVFKKKVCLHCGGKLTGYDKLVSANLNSKIDLPDGDYDGYMTYQKAYQCKNCGHQFSIAELIDKENKHA
ncbi:MAG: hypothetical protein FWE80_03215 [Oscillospiraceae bacterium]|nr:hypothetical protein [Oscillospiraceae bacterium]